MELAGLFILANWDSASNISFWQLALNPETLELKLCIIWSISLKLSSLLGNFCYIYFHYFPKTSLSFWRVLDTQAAPSINKVFSELSWNFNFSISFNFSLNNLFYSYALFTALLLFLAIFTVSETHLIPGGFLEYLSACISLFSL